VGESLDIVTEDGKTPAPDGEHELSLRDSSGNENLIKVKTEGGKIVERENVELQEEGEEEVKEEAIEDMVAALIDALTPDEVSSEVAEDIAEKVLDALEDKIEILKKRKSIKMAEEEELPSGDGVEEEVDPLPEDEVDMKKKYEDMTYRIEELEKRIAKMEEAQPSEEEKEEADVMEDKTPKLDGAPIDDVKMNAVFSKQSKKSGVENAQNSFLAKLYK
jgi:hypothetical protein